MSGDPYGPIEAEIRRDFGSGLVTRKSPQPSQVLFRIEGQPAPAGCTPKVIRILLAFSSPSVPPEVLVDPVPSLANGTPTPNLRPKQVDGEIWNDYSAQWSWDASLSAWENVRRKVMRFASSK